VVRYFPDKLPIGVQPHSHPHVLLYLVSNPSPMDFRLFLLRHMALLTVLHRWTIRLLVPRQLKRAQLLYLRAAREHLAEALHPSVVEGMEWYFRERQHPAAGDQPATGQRFERAASASALHVSELFTVTGSHTAPTACGLPVRRKRPMPSSEITGAWSASNSHASICISLPWLTSPDPAQLGTTSGRPMKLRLSPSARTPLRAELGAGGSADSRAVSPKSLAATMFESDSRALSE
jgi:hypothetical protein